MIPILAADESMEEVPKDIVTRLAPSWFGNNVNLQQKCQATCELSHSVKFFSKYV